jgi:hypothetical protein
MTGLISFRLSPMVAWSGAANYCDLPGCTTVSVTIPGGAGSLIIAYGYDPLRRLTSALIQPFFIPD